MTSSSKIAATAAVSIWSIITEEILVLGLIVALVYCLYTEYLDNKNFQSKFPKKRKKILPKKYRASLVPPVYYGSTIRKPIHMDVFSLNHFIPVNTIVSSTENELTENQINQASRPVTMRRKSQRPSEIGVRPSFTHAPLSPIQQKGNISDIASPGDGNGTAQVGTDDTSQTAPTTDDPYQFDVCAKITYPFMPGCEPDCPTANALAEKYPELTRPDIVRYLVARKGNQKAAEEMIDKCLAWRKSSFPLKRSEVLAAFKTKCFFPYGVSKDGSPVVYMRGGLYDANVATPHQYVMAAAYTIDWAIRQHPDQVNVTVLVHTVNIPGGPNQAADTNFIKLFIQVLSDNYPERLKRLAIFPFPWYGRAIWGVLKVFVDKRTQDKVMLLSKATEKGLPQELLDCMDLDQMPEFVGGTCKEPIIDLLDTLED